MPKKPSYIDKVNFIQFWLSNPCNFPWMVYIETAIPAAGKAVWQLVEFGFLDLIRAFFRPKTLRGGRHGRKPRRGKKPKAAIPEVAEAVAERIPGYGPVAHREVSDGVKTLWRIDGVVQRVLYYWLLVDVISDFWYNWLVGIVEDPRSDCENLGRALRTEDQQVIRPGGWTTYFAHDLIYEHFPIVTTSTWVGLGPGKFCLVCTAKARIYIWGGIDAEAQLGIAVGGPGGKFLSVSARKTLTISQEVELACSAFAEGPGVLDPLCFCRGDFVEFYDIRWFCMQMGEPD
jgi:hypothetical protein